MAEVAKDTVDDVKEKMDKDTVEEEKVEVAEEAFEGPAIHGFEDTGEVLEFPINWTMRVRYPSRFPAIFTRYCLSS